MNTSNIVWGIVAIVVIIIVALYFSGTTSNTLPSALGTGGASTSTPTSTDTTTPGTQSTTTSTSSDSGTTSSATSNSRASTTITYTRNGFSPMTVSIPQGGTVTFVNKSNTGMWIASDPHPTHQEYSGTPANQHCPDRAGTAFDQCAPGNTYSFTFKKIGTWGYHNHLQDEYTGTIVVQ